MKDFIKLEMYWNYLGLPCLLCGLDPGLRLVWIETVPFGNYSSWIWTTYSEEVLPIALPENALDCELFSLQQKHA